MRLARIQIDKFAAIRNRRLEPTPITVIHGPNESLKTMLLDALLEALFGRGRLRGQFEGLGRYSKEDAFQGEVSVEMDDGQKLSFPHKMSLEQLAKLPNLSVRNLLVVRSGEADFHQEESWWDSIRDNLTGFEGGFRKVEQLIRGEVGLTPKDDWTDKEGMRIKGEYRALQERRDSLSEAQHHAQNANKLQVELESLKREAGECRAALERLESARKRDKYRDASNWINEYNGLRANLQNYLEHSDKDYDEWQDQEKQLTKISTEMESFNNRDKDLRDDIWGRDIKLKELEKRINDWEAREVDVFHKVDKWLKEMQDRKREVERAGGWEPFSLAGALVGAAVAMVFLYFSIERGGTYYAGLAASAVAALFLALKWATYRKRRATLKREENDLREMLQNVEPDMKAPGEARNWIDERRGTHQQRIGEKKVLEEELKELDTQLNKVKNELSAALDSKHQLEGRIEELKRSTGCSSAENLNRKLQEKKALEASMESKKREINLVLEVDSESKRQDAFNKLKEYANATGTWDPAEAQRLEGKMRTLEQSITSTSGQLTSVRDNLIRVGCSTPEDVFIELDETTRELGEYDLKRAAALAAIKAINDMAGEQDTIINSVIGEGFGSAQAFFSNITGGRYTGVFRDRDAVRVRRHDSLVFSIDQLSTGTQAQLYFALRVSLMNRIFDEPPFLLLDDPFLSADDQRLRAVMDFLKEIAGRGWQIIYFTVDGRVVSLLNGAEGYSSVHL